MFEHYEYNHTIIDALHNLHAHGYHDFDKALQKYQIKINFVN